MFKYRDEETAKKILAAIKDMGIEPLARPDGLPDENQ